VSPYESGRRLCLLAEAGRTRLCVEATSVTEVSVPPPGATTLRGGVEVRDLSVLLGGPPETEPGMVVVFDVSPTLAVRVRSVVEVTDVSASPTFSLPAALGEPLLATTRGALLHKEHLYLELKADALPRQPGVLGPPPTREPGVLRFSPDRALVFESQGRLFGLPLLQVLQVVACSPAFYLLPVPGGPIAGLQPHAERLWPVYSPAGSQEGAGSLEPFCVLVEVGGRRLGLFARRVLGVYTRFRAEEEPGTFMAPGLPGPALFLDWQAVAC
jgi:hypothetical protein